MIERAENSGDQGFSFNAHAIATRTGFRLAITYPRWETDAAGIIQFGEDVDDYGKRFGYENVIGSLFLDEGKLALGVFVRGRATAIDAEAHDIRGSLEPRPPGQLAP